MDNSSNLESNATPYKIVNFPDIALLKIVGSIDFICPGNWFYEIENLSKLGYRKIILDCNEAYVCDHIDAFFLSLVFPNDSVLSFVIYAKKKSRIVEYYYNGILNGVLKFVLGSMKEWIEYLNK
jgi:hypothetical protein